MNGLQFIGDLRSKGIKPVYVMLDIVPRKALPAWISGDGAHVEVGEGESLADLDCRPLVGLTVHLGADGCPPAKLRRLARMVAEAKPSLLCVYTAKEDSYTLDRLHADGKHDRVSIP